MAKVPHLPFFFVLKTINIFKGKNGKNDKIVFMSGNEIILAC